MAAQTAPTGRLDPELARLDFGVLACWLLALAFGVAFWTSLFLVAAPTILRIAAPMLVRLA